ncbi:MAG: hypothetical protein WCS39_01545 [Bacteroidales bacterium]|jgi:hypothetical protein
MKYYFFIFIVLIFFPFKLECGITSSNITYNLVDKEKYILESICNEIINKNKDFINKRKTIIGCKSPLFLYVREEEGKFKGFKCYYVFFSERSFSVNDLPTYLCKKQGVYIAIYMSNLNSMPIKEIPRKLFHDDRCYGSEDSWVILICNESYKYKVIDIMLLPYIAVKQYQEFSCEGNENNDKMKTPIEIENAIVDTVLLKKLYNGER